VGAQRSPPSATGVTGIESQRSCWRFSEARWAPLSAQFESAADGGFVFFFCNVPFLQSEGK
jgi:hypothetical protein